MGRICRNWLRPNLDRRQSRLILEPCGAMVNAARRRLHIPLGRKEVITICGQGSAGSIVGFEGRKKYLLPALRALFKILS